MIIPNFKVIVTTETRRLYFFCFVVNGQLVVKNGRLNGKSLGPTYSHVVSVLSVMEYINKKVSGRYKVECTYNHHFYNSVGYKRVNNITDQ